MNGPEDFKHQLGALPEGARFSREEEETDQLHWFVKSRDEVKAQVKKIISQLKDGMLLWIYFPKKTSGIQTDLTRDMGWEPLLQNELQWLVLVSFNETWSAFAMRRKTSAILKKKSTVSSDGLQLYLDPDNKTVQLPPDLLEAFNNEHVSKRFFATLSFTNKKEYLVWILSAKKEETRKTRIQNTIQKLKDGRKNPSGRG
jgi:hypothetical protein